MSPREDDTSSSTVSTVIVITGASRGFGRALAIVASEFYNGNCSLVLVARSMEGLEETASLILKKEKCSCHAMDLGDLDQLDTNIEALLKELQAYSKIIFIQNAGTIGHLGRCRDSPDLKEMQANVNLNITSTLWLSSRITKYARSSSKDLVLVDISSLVATAEFPTFGIYSTGKVARDKYHSIIAREESACNETEESTVRTLNYAPGPLETDMVAEIRQSFETIDKSLHEPYSKLQLDPIDSARRLFLLLDENTFKSGDHIDYFDLQPPNSDAC